MTLQIINITKSYQDKCALDHVTTQMKPGVIGLLGANGSGKTTLIRILVGVLDADEGTVIYNGKDTKEHRKDFLTSLGYLPQHFGLYPDFKVEEFLRYIGAMKGLTKQYTEQRINILLKQLHLTNVRKKKIKTLSGGMKQRVGIAQALLNDPKILILDEPTVGLDPKERNEFTNMISSIADDKVIILSTHIVSDIESCANTILILKEGKIVADDQPRNLLQKLNGHVIEETVSKQTYNEIAKNHVICSHIIQNDTVTVRYLTDENAENNLVQPNLNDLYLSIFGQEEE